MTRAAAQKLLKTARLARSHERTGAALAAGDITVPHVEMLAEVAHRRDDLYAEHEDTLLETAKTVEVLDFPAVTRRWATLADDELARRHAAFGFERRGFTLSPTAGGSAVSGFLDPEAGATVKGVLDELQPPDGASDTRSAAQRRADALVLLCERARGGNASRVATDRRCGGRRVAGRARPPPAGRTWRAALRDRRFRADRAHHRGAAGVRLRHRVAS